MTSPVLRAFQDPRLAFVSCTAIWGGGWLAIRASVEGGAPIGTAAVRAAAAAAIFLGLAVAFRIPAPDRRGVAGALAAGAVFIGVNLGLVYTAAPLLPSGMAALLYATAPLQAVLLGPLLVRGDCATRRGLLGAAVGVAGVAVAFGRAGDGAVTAAPAAIVLFAATASAAGSALTRRAGALHFLWLNALANVGGAFLLAPASLALERGSPLPHSAAGWAGFAYMLGAGSVAAMVLYTRLLRAWETSRATLVGLVAPFIALALGAAVAGEPVSALAVAGAALVLGGGAVAMRTPRGGPACLWGPRRDLARIA